MPDIRPMHATAARQGTAHHLAKALGSFATSRREVAVAFAGLAIASALPGAGIPTLAAGTALLGLHVAALRGVAPGLPRSWKDVRDLFRASPADSGRSVTLATDLDGRPFTMDDDQIRQHLLVLGTDGPRRDTILSLCEQVAGNSSGFVVCDGKGDVTTYAAVHEIARRLGREDDLLVLNLMTGHPGKGQGFLSHTLNPFATGSSNNLTQLVVGLMDEVGGDGAMWKGRATAMLTGVMRALTWMREEGRVELDVDVVRRHIHLGAIVDLADPAIHPDMPPDIRVSVRSYLGSLPGYREERRHKQAQVTLDQHGYLEMQFARILGSLADVYGHVFRTDVPDIDMTDVVSNRRILVVLLPALERSGDELANLGKIVVATLKGMMGAALANRIEGNWNEVVDSRASFTRNPFMCVLDDVGYYTVEGLALMSAQARSLGFAMVYASQDIPAMKRHNEKEAASIIANTNTKMFIGQDGDADAFSILRGDRLVQGVFEPAPAPPRRSAPITNHLVAIRRPRSAQ